MVPLLTTMCSWYTQSTIKWSVNKSTKTFFLFFFTLWNSCRPKIACYILYISSVLPFGVTVSHLQGKQTEISKENFKSTTSVSSVDFIVAVRHGNNSSATLSEIGQTHNSRGCLLNDPADIIQWAVGCRSHCNLTSRTIQRLLDPSSLTPHTVVLMGFIVKTFAFFRVDY